MTPQEKAMMTNPTHIPFMDMPGHIRNLMKDNTENLQRLRGSGEWKTCKGYSYLADGYIYRVDPGAPTQTITPPALPVFCGSDGVYKVSLTRGNITSTRYLATLVCMKGFNGIRYSSSDEWRSTLDTMTYGTPLFVRMHK